MRVLRGTLTTLHLCGECARLERQERLPGFPGGATPFFIVEIERHSRGEGGGHTEEEGDRCQVCGKSPAEVEAAESYGCPECEDRACERLGAIVARLAEVEATVPAPSPAGESPVEEMIRLRSALRRAIAQEAFEEAARLRDAIHALEAAQGKGRRDRLRR